MAGCEGRQDRRRGWGWGMGGGYLVRRAGRGERPGWSALACIGRGGRLPDEEG
jgi:hypothetical protein